MALRLSMKPTGWFQIAWSAEIPPGAVRPMKYFGEDLVAFRTVDGELAVLEAHCLHLGAHLGHGGKVVGRSVACPYHGWQWGTDGHNTLIPYEDHTIRKPLRKWHVVEQHGLIFLWHDPAGGAPREGWQLPNLFSDFPDLVRAEDEFYPCHPNAVVDRPDEPIHPQLIQENAADCMHFRYTHGAPEDPQLLWFETTGPRWRASMGFTSPKTQQIALRTHAINFGVGLSFTIFDGNRQHYRLVLSCTPVDEERSHCRVSYWFPRDAASPQEMPESLRAFARHTGELFEQDARIWRHQKFVHRPIYAKQDVAGYSALRKWCEQFYETPEQLAPGFARLKDVAC